VGERILGGVQRAGFGGYISEQLLLELSTGRGAAKSVISN
jgi:hypothetical protein